MKTPELPIFIDTNMRNACNRMTPAAYQRLLTNVVERYFRPSGQDINEMFRQGRAFAYVADTTEILHAFDYTDDIICRIWLSEEGGAASRLELAYYNRTRNEISFVSAVYFLVIDMVTRCVVRDPKSTMDFSYFSRGERLITSSSRISVNAEEMECAGSIIIPPSWIDAVGHADNVRYPDMAYDVLSEGKRAAMDRLRRSEIYFQRELSTGERVTLKKTESEEEAIVVGIRADSIVAFVCRLCFEKQ